MSVTLLNWRDVTVSAATGPVSVILNGNVDTTMRARFWWYPKDPNAPADTRIVEAGQAYVLTAEQIQEGALRRVGLVFVATPVTPLNPHLFVRLVVARGTSTALDFTYELDLPAGHNKWTLSDGFTLQP